MNLSHKKEVTDTVIKWLSTMELGDTIRFNGASLIFRNSSGCELDSVNV